MKKKTVYIIILNYNGYKDTSECVTSLTAGVLKENLEYTIVVVDNNSTDNSYEYLNNTLPENVVLLQAVVNNGYASGNNLGIRYALDHNADYICILNNDTIVKEDFLEPCIALLEKDSTVGIVGPMMLNYHNELVQNTGGRISLIKGKSYELNKNTPKSSIKDEIVKCDMVYGAAMVFRSSLIERIGYIPENYFLFYEETEWCYRAIRSGLKNMIITTVTVIHKGSQSLKKLTNMQTYLMERNRTLFVKRNATSIQFSLFLAYDFGRTLYRSVLYRIPFVKYSGFHIDGIKGSFTYKCG